MAMNSSSDSLDELINLLEGRLEDKHTTTLAAAEDLRRALVVACSMRSDVRLLERIREEAVRSMEDDYELRERGLEVT
jgi:hypothetical protein